MFKKTADLFSLQKMRDDVINKGEGYNEEERNKLHSIPVPWMKQSKMAFGVGKTSEFLFQLQRALKHLPLHNPESRSRSPLLPAELRNLFVNMYP